MANVPAVEGEGERQSLGGNEDDEEEVKPTLDDFLADLQIQQAYQDEELLSVLQKVEEDPATLETHLQNQKLQNVLRHIYRLVAPYLPPLSEQEEAEMTQGMPGMGMPGADMPGAGMPGMGMSGAGMSGAGMPGMGMSGAGMPGMGMSGAGMSGAGMPGMGMSGAGMPGMGMSGAGMPGMGMSGAGLPGRGMPGMNVQGVGGQQNIMNLLGGNSASNASSNTDFEQLLQNLTRGQQGLNLEALNKRNLNR